MDTVFALATARGKAGIAVFRISGARAHAVVSELCGSLPLLRTASLRRLVWRGEVLDDALVILFGPGASFTGEEMAELQVHGSLAVVQSLTRVLSGQPGLRQAAPGEFTRRALENGRLDLTQVEGLADLIDAETEAQHRQAMRVLSGAIGRRAEGWRQKLIRAAALVEASIDFADEEVPTDVGPEASGLMREVRADLEKEIVGARVAERLREGFEVAIVGPPNAGKSTLLNMLAGREAAITSETAGTTRDVIEVRMNLDGLPITILDTAGLRESNDNVERLGIDRALQRARMADIRVFLLDELGSLPFLAPTADDIVVQGKADLLLGRDDAISGLTGQGVDGLIRRIAGILEKRVSGAGVMAHERHRAAMLRAFNALESALDEVGRPEWKGEFLAAELWTALRALDQLVGRVDVEDLLDEIFSSFCIGK